MRYLYVTLYPLLLFAGCTVEQIEDVNAIGTGMVDAAPAISTWNPAYGLLLIAAGGTITAICGALLRSKKKKGGK